MICQIIDAVEIVLTVAALGRERARWCLFQTPAGIGGLARISVAP